MSNREILDWKTWKVGDNVIFYNDDTFDCFREEGKVIEKYADHLIVAANGMELWVDDDTTQMFMKEVRK